MSHTSMILTAIMMMAMVVFIAPNIFALNRGHILRNIALWLAIFLGLAIFYQNFGPGSEHPLFKMPDAMQGMNKQEAPKLNIPFFNKGDKSDDTKDNNKDDGDTGTDGFTPPKE